MRKPGHRIVVVCTLVGLAACDSSPTGRTDRAEGGPPSDSRADGTVAGDAGKSDLASPIGDAARSSDGSSPGTNWDTSTGTPDVGPSVLDGSSGLLDVPLGTLDSLPSVPGVDGASDRGVAGSPDTVLSCGQAGAVCQTAGDCCGLACLAGRCSVSACVSDGQSCTSGGECCSTLCGADGKCGSLNPLCKTAGNACTASAECCNGTCNANHQCASPADVSFCAQTGDLCRADRECCTGVCSLRDGGTVGTCASLTTSCKIDGTLCNGCGDCCSHFCGPYGTGSAHICQPASGCHVQGDLCRKDSDCCGGDVGSGLPGAGLIKCEPDPVYGARIGTCGNPTASNCPNGSPTCKNSCNPEGNVCHFKQTLVCAGNLTNVRNDCCACISGKECCQPDATGIPRCNALAACVPTGGSCSFSGECCNREPCLPDPVTGQLKCGSTCVLVGGACTTNGDCCAGMLCQAAPGSVGGICVIPTPPPSVLPDAGLPTQDALAPADDGPLSSPDAPLVCAFYGQACSTSVPCCGDTLCRAAGGVLCSEADTDCLCFSPEL